MDERFLLLLFLPTPSATGVDGICLSPSSADFSRRIEFRVYKALELIRARNPNENVINYSYFCLIYCAPKEKKRKKYGAQTFYHFSLPITLHHSVNFFAFVFTISHRHLNRIFLTYIRILSS